MNVYKFIKIRHEILIQCHGNFMEMRKFNYMLEIDISRNSSQKDLGVLRGSFQKRHPDALLAESKLWFMSSWVGLLAWVHYFLRCFPAGSVTPPGLRCDSYSLAAYPAAPAVPCHDSPTGALSHPAPAYSVSGVSPEFSPVKTNKHQ